MREHDFTAGRWGWQVEVWKSPDGDPSIEPTSWAGYGYGLRVGDAILYPMQSGKVGRWRITALRYVSDPPDMFWADAVLDGYSDLAAARER